MRPFYTPEGTSGSILRSHRPSFGPSVRYKSCLSDSSKTTEANLMKLHRKINIMGRFLPTRCRFLRPRSRLQSGQRSKSCFSNNSKATEANLTKLHRKMEIIRRCVTHKSKVPETFSVKLCHSQSKMAIYVTLPNLENKSLVIIYNISAFNP